MAEMIIGVSQDGKQLKMGIPDAPASVSPPNYRYVYHPFPKMVYKNEPDEEAGTTFTAVTVKTAGELAALGDGWYESPAEFPGYVPEVIDKKRKPGRPKKEQP